MSYVNPPSAAEQLTFASEGTPCAAWWTSPTTPAPWPALVLVHGLGATHEMALPYYERAFSAAGIAVLSFDYRHLGESGGVPRNLITVRGQLADVAAALAYVRSRPDVDCARVGLWGTSFGAAHVFSTAARDCDLAAAVVQCPIIDGLSAARALGLRAGLGLTGPVARDLLARLLRRPRPTMPIVGQPGQKAFVTVPGAEEGWRSLMPESYTFGNAMMASLALTLPRYRPARLARQIACPLLVTVSQRETLMDPAVAVRAAADAPNGQALLADADHFEVYHSPLVEHLVAEQIAFLRTHLLAS